MFNQSRLESTSCGTPRCQCNARSSMFANRRKYWGGMLFMLRPCRCTTASTNGYAVRTEGHSVTHSKPVLSLSKGVTACSCSCFDCALWAFSTNGCSCFDCVVARRSARTVLGPPRWESDMSCPNPSLSPARRGRKLSRSALNKRKRGYGEEPSVPLCSSSADSAEGSPAGV